VASAAVTVVVSSRNAASVITKQLDAIYVQLRGGDEMIVIDDASTDDTSAVVCEWKGRHHDRPVTVLRALTRGGPNASRNAGTAFATCNLLAFTDADDVVNPGWLDALRAACAPRTLVAGVYRCSGINTPVPPVPMFGFPMVLGSSMAMERRVVHAVGGFDENILRGGTENEFALRAQAVFSMNVIVAPDAAITYWDPSSPKLRLAKAWSRTKGHSYINAKYKHLPSVQESIPSLRSLISPLPKALIRLLVPRREIPRSTYAMNIATLPASVFWLVIYRFRLPPERRFRAALKSRYQVVVVPATTEPGRTATSPRLGKSCPLHNAIP
jgi:glycosyltransferase involved in cell wall biosynthesis